MAFCRAQSYTWGMKQRHPNAGKLAEAIKTRRAAMHWSYSRVKSNGGPTKPTQMTYEAGDIPDNVTSDMLAKIDLGMGWESGTALTILGGGTAPEPGTAVVEEGDVGEDLLGERLPHLFQQLQQLRRDLRGADLPAQARDTLEEITSIQNDILMDRIGKA